MCQCCSIKDQHFLNADFPIKLVYHQSYIIVVLFCYITHLCHRLNYSIVKKIYIFIQVLFVKRTFFQCYPKMIPTVSMSPFPYEDMTPLQHVHTPRHKLKIPESPLFHCKTHSLTHNLHVTYHNQRNSESTVPIRPLMRMQKITI